MFLEPSFEHPTFWGESENAVRIQIHVAIITYCLIGIIEKKLQLNRPIIQVMRILGSGLLLKENMLDLFSHPALEKEKKADQQLNIDFDYD